MKVHLIRSSGYSVEDFNNVLNLLRKNQGSIEFVPSEPIILPNTELFEVYKTKEDFETKRPPDLALCSISESRDFPYRAPVYTWDQLFWVCRNFRNEHNIEEKDLVILLNDIQNDKNWFGCVDETMRNFFVQTNDWNWYFGDSIDDRFPIAYEIVSWIMRSLMFPNLNEIVESLRQHVKPRGCMMDYCKDKTEIVLKMRTADLCSDCLQQLDRRDVNRTQARQLFLIMDGLRENLMFRQRSQLLRQYSNIEIRGFSKSIFLTDLGDLQINLNPKEKALYMLYLNHTEGISRSHLVDFRDELRSYYAMFSSQSTNEAIDLAINRLIDITDNNMNEVMARIRSKFKKAVGEDQAKDYSIVSTPEGNHKILINRELVHFVD